MYEQGETRMIRMFKSITHFILLLILALALAPLAIAADSHDASSHSAQPQEVGAKVSCGSCGMYPASYPKWMSQVILADGSMTPFDGCKCMFKYLLNQDGKMAKEAAAIWIKDFNNGSWVDAGDAHFVVNSDVMGPMGKELIPFADHMSAMAFQKEHGGSMAKYADITMASLMPLMHHKDMGSKEGDHVNKGHDMSHKGHGN